LHKQRNGWNIEYHTCEVKEKLPKILWDLSEMKIQKPSSSLISLGGWSITFEALQQWFEKVYYVDLDKWMCNLMEQIKKGIPENRNNRVSKSEFEEMKKKDDAYSVAMSICFSFWNKRETYAYSKELEPRKKALHYAVVFEDYSLLEKIWINWRFEWKTVEARRLEIKSKTDLGTLKHLASEYSDSWIYSLQTMQALQNIERLQNIEILNTSYKKLLFNTPSDLTVIYCDPPYRWTSTYVVQKTAFDYKSLDKRFRELPYQAYMSEENPHQIALTMTKQRTMQMKSRSKVFEVLYTNKVNSKREIQQQNLFT